MSESTSIDTADVLAVDARVIRATASEGFGLTERGFVPKPFARLLAEKLALARELFGADIDLTSGSAIRKILEVSALEDARTWAHLTRMYDDNFVTSATGNALSALGAELGIVRPQLEARGTVKLVLKQTLPAGFDPLTLGRGARLLTPGGHHAALDETVVLSNSVREREVAVVAFYPGPEHNLDPALPQQLIDSWHEADDLLAALRSAADELSGTGPALALTDVVGIDHTTALSGGELTWPDDRYRSLLLSAPRSIWTVDAIRLAVSLVPGVRQVQVRDARGGLDIQQSIFGNFNFIERLFGSERDLGSPYYFTVLVAPTPAAIWDGPDGLHVAVQSAIEDLRPIGIFPEVKQAVEVAVGIEAQLVVQGLPLPSGAASVVNASEPATALKERLVERLRRYVDGLGFGEPVRLAEVVWSLMNEPGVADAKEVRLVLYPPPLSSLEYDGIPDTSAVHKLECGQNLELTGEQIAVFIDDTRYLTIV